MIHAALSWQGTSYSLFNFNCESFANAVHEGSVTSRQVDRGIVTSAVVGAFGLLSWLGSRPTYDAGVDRYRNRKGRFTKR